MDGKMLVVWKSESEGRVVWLMRNDDKHPPAVRRRRHSRKQTRQEASLSFALSLCSQTIDFIVMHF